MRGITSAAAALVGVGIVIAATAGGASAQFGGSPSPGAPATTGPPLPARPTAPGAPKMTPHPPQSNPLLPPGSPGSSVPARNPMENSPPPAIQPLPRPNTAQPNPSPTLPTVPRAASPQPAEPGSQQQAAASPPLGSFAACMALWDKELSMSKRAWAASCRDTIPPRGGSLYGYVAQGSHRGHNRRHVFTKSYWLEPDRPDCD